MSTDYFFCQNGFGYLCERVRDDSLKVLRAYGNKPVLFLPEYLDSRKITEIGDYCFSGKNPNPVDQDWLQIQLHQWQQEQGQDYCEIAGDYLQEIQLSTVVDTIGDFAFYNCRNLEKLTMNRHLQKLGCDAFMNCMKLRDIYIEACPDDRTGLSLVLKQRDGNTQVHFFDKKQEMAQLYFPEYYEVYDEIGPAHIFKLNLSGEGFRARQCFHEGVMDFSGYDQIFDQAVNSEEERNLIHMALGRLRFPYQLSPAAEEKYRDYLSSHGLALIRNVMKQRQISLLEELDQQELLPHELVDDMVELAIQSDWAEGNAQLLRMQMEWSADIPAVVEDEYSFD